MPTTTLNSKVRAAIQSSVLCWLATVDAAGQPNVSPKEIFAAFDGMSGETSLIIANIASPQSVKNVQACNKVCVSFVDVFTQKGYKVKGLAQYLRQEDIGYPARHAILSQMAGDQFPIQGIVSVTVTAVSPIVAPSYRLLPNVTEQQQITGALKTYGVTKATD